MGRLNTFMRLGVLLVLAAVSGNMAMAADEAELKVWLFRNSSEAWNGNGPLKHGVWPVRDNALRLRGDANAKSLYLGQNELRLPAEKANVVQIQVDASSSNKGRLWFATGVSPAINQEKMVEFDIKPGAGMQDYTLDLKSVPTWKDQISFLRFEFIGMKAEDELSVRCVKVFYGEKISTPMIYTSYKLGSPPAIREFRLGFLFNDNMVLQRNKPVPLWGRGKAGEAVTVKFAGQSKNCTTDSSGKWQVILEPMQASGEPRTLIASSETNGHRVKLENVLVGDVWLCGGQSNMGGSPFDNAPPQERRKELLETDYPMFRYVSIPALHRETPLPNDATEDSLAWRPIQVKSLGGVSAVSYYFGQSIHASQKIPIGEIHIIKAGSQVEQWLGSEALKEIFSDDELKRNCNGTHLASGLHNGMVAPLAPFPICGAMWYQGESNADNEFKYMGYYKSLPALIRSWRSTWGNDLPVFIVQLPAFDGGYPPESWAHIREVQLLCALNLPNVGMAVTFDEGDPKNLHPANKYLIGGRLGLAARAMAYGEKIGHSGPVYAGMERNGNAVSLRFEHVGAGLKARGELKSFEIRGADQRWLPAKAEISGKDHVMLTNPDIARPEAARYAWANNPTATLFSSFDLPASPFRTDVPAQLIETVKLSGASLKGK